MLVMLQQLPEDQFAIIEKNICLQSVPLQPISQSIIGTKRRKGTRIIKSVFGFQLELVLLTRQWPPAQAPTRFSSYSSASPGRQTRAISKQMRHSRQHSNHRPQTAPCWSLGTTTSREFHFLDFIIILLNSPATSLLICKHSPNTHRFRLNFL